MPRRQTPLVTPTASKVVPYRTTAPTESQTELLQHSAGDCAHFEKMAAAPQGPGRLLPHIISSCSCGWMSYLRAVLVRVRQSLENLGDCCCVVELELS